MDKEARMSTDQFQSSTMRPRHDERPARASRTARVGQRTGVTHDWVDLEERVGV